MTEIEVRESGQRVLASVGDQLTVVVPENATAGYAWVVGDHEPTIAGVERDDRSPTARPGSPAERRIVFRVRGMGEATVTSDLARDWWSQPKRRFTFTVVGS